MFTERDMRDQIIESLGGEVDEFSIDGITEEIQRRYGTVNIDRVPSDIYWEIVSRHNF